MLLRVRMNVGLRGVWDVERLEAVRKREFRKKKKGTLVQRLLLPLLGAG